MNAKRWLACLISISIHSRLISECCPFGNLFFANESDSWEVGLANEYPLF